eukprot:jgi/Antlo1/491/2041
MVAKTNARKISKRTTDVSPSGKKRPDMKHPTPTDRMKTGSEMRNNSNTGIFDARPRWMTIALGTQHLAGRGISKTRPLMSSAPTRGLRKMRRLCAKSLRALSCEEYVS